jgi:hypothetical protein
MSHRVKFKLKLTFQFGVLGFTAKCVILLNVCICLQVWKREKILKLQTVHVHLQRKYTAEEVIQSVTG